MHRQRPLFALRLGLIGFVFSLSTTAAAVSQQPLATIEGGAQQDGNFRWTITNNHDSPIVFVEIPHHMGDLFEPPEGWEQECTHLVGRGGEPEPGVCRASTDRAGLGIAPGRTDSFFLRVAANEPRRGQREVLVRFTDGTEFSIPGVEVPIRAATIETYGGLLGFSLLFVLIAIVEIRRRRKATAAKAAVQADIPPAD